MTICTGLALDVFSSNENLEDEIIIQDNSGEKKIFLQAHGVYSGPLLISVILP